MIDPKIFQLEEDIREWDRKYPVWLTASKDIKDHSYLVPDHYQSVSVIKDDTLKCLRNICTHKQALILEGNGSVGPSITCPIHKWAWDKDGNIKHSRGIEPCKNANLTKHDFSNWEGHMFIGPTNWMKDITKLEDLQKFLNIEGYTHHSSVKLEYNFDWKIFFEIFLDLYHVKTYHPGLRSLTDCTTFDWKFGDNWSCQTALFNKSMPTEKHYAELYEIYKRTGHYDSAKYGAVWLGIYPNIMLEYYPGCYVVSTVWPNGSGKCVNYLDFYYEEGLVDKEPTFPQVQQKSFMSTADEDEQIGTRIARGRAMLKDPIEFINHPLEEAGTKHFYNWLEQNYIIK